MLHVVESLIALKLNRIESFERSWSLLEVLLDIILIRLLVSFKAISSVEKVWITNARCAIRKLASFLNSTNSVIVLSEDELVVVLVHLSDVVLQQLFRVLLAFLGNSRRVNILSVFCGWWHEGRRIYRHDILYSDSELNLHRAELRSVTRKPVFDCLSKDSRAGEVSLNDFGGTTHSIFEFAVLVEVFELRHCIFHPFLHFVRVSTFRSKSLSLTVFFYSKVCFKYKNTFFILAETHFLLFIDENYFRHLSIKLNSYFR